MTETPPPGFAFTAALRSLPESSVIESRVGDDPFSCYAMLPDGQRVIVDREGVKPLQSV